MLILGIDPGSRKTGYGIIESIKHQQLYIASGHIKIIGNNLGYKLKQIYDDLLQIIDKYNPQQVSIEKVFVHKNVASALKLGQARGAAMVAAASLNLPIHEYSARTVKQTIVGNGNASKQQVQLLIQNLLLLNKVPQQDAADALAIAMCHAIHANKYIS